MVRKLCSLLFREFLCALLVLSIAPGLAKAQTTIYSGPAGSGAFGTAVTVLPNGNYVVCDAGWDDGATADVGAVYLFNGSTHALISRLTGSTANDRAGSDGINVVGTSNFIVRSGYWSNGGMANAGAITWCSGATGLNGTISSANSVIGTNANMYLGSQVQILPNGNYVARASNWKNGSATNAGAVIWGSGTAGVTGPVSSSNALVGSSTNDYVGNINVTVLTNNNYVVCASQWANGSISGAGAAIWCSGTTGKTGVISASNALVGSNAGDYIGSNGVFALTNGNYVVNSYSWRNGTNPMAGASTWGDGTTGITGAVSATNSLVGPTAYSYTGISCTPLSNGNYVVRTNYSNGTATSLGAITWGNGTTGTTGNVSAANSLVGANSGDDIGTYGIGALTNGNYVVRSPSWQNGALTSVGAMTWCSGTAATTGTVTAANSLVGSSQGDNIGYTFKALSNGNYVAGSYNWKNGTAGLAGAARFCSGTSATTGTFSAANSLVGTKANDYVGVGGVVALSNGNYVVCSRLWDNASIVDAGAATWGSGTTGVSGAVSASNSLVGTTANDLITDGGITVLTNGNYVVRSYYWSNGTATMAGAATWGNGSTGVAGAVSASNSLVGTSANNVVGNAGIQALSNGHYIVRSSSWTNGSITEAGAVTWCNGTTGRSGAVSSANSLTATTPYGNLGMGSVTERGPYVLVHHNSYSATGAANTGAVAPLSIATGLPVGNISACNSIIGTAANNGTTFVSAYNAAEDYVIAGKPGENRFFVFRDQGHGTAGSTDQHTRTVAASPVTFGSSACAAIASLAPAGASPVSGSVSATAYVQSTAPSFNGAPYVRRHYDITPAANASTATARVTLYFTQADFDDYNANRGTAPQLPTGPTDSAGRSVLRVTQHHGTSATGLPGSYSGWAGSGPARLAIDPADADVFWNIAESRWEVSFGVTGFSGFFVYSAAAATPLSLFGLQATAKAAGSVNRIDWSLEDEQAGTVYEIQRLEAGSYRSLGLVNASRASSYSFTDERPLAPASYYRIRVTQQGAGAAYSETMLVTRSQAGMVQLAPVPAANTLEISCGDPSLVGTEAAVTNMQGVVMIRFGIAARTRIDISSWKPGVYSLRLADGSVRSLTKL